MFEFTEYYAGRNKSSAEGDRQLGYRTMDLPITHNEVGKGGWNLILGEVLAVRSENFSTREMSHHLI